MVWERFLYCLPLRLVSFNKSSAHMQIIQTIRNGDAEIARQKTLLEQLNLRSFES